MTDIDPEAPSRTTRKVHGSAGPLTAGVGGLLLAVLLVVIGQASALVGLVIVGALIGLVGAVFLVAGVYQLAENIDSAARALVER